MNPKIKCITNLLVILVLLALVVLGAIKWWSKLFVKIAVSVAVGLIVLFSFSFVRGVRGMLHPDSYESNPSIFSREGENDNK